MSEFRREGRYFVIKRSDMQAALSVADQYLLEQLGEICDNHRVARGADPMECVVVESDWPDYEVVWDMIQARSEGNPTRLEQLESNIAESSTDLPDGELVTTIAHHAMGRIFEFTRHHDSPLIHVDLNMSSGRLDNIICDGGVVTTGIPIEYSGRDWDEFHIICNNWMSQYAKRSYISW